MSPVLRGQVVPVHAEADQAVEIHWRLPDGRIVVERRTAPPKPVLAARAATTKRSDE